MRCHAFAASSRRPCTIGATAKACDSPRIRILEPWLLAIDQLSSGAAHAFAVSPTAYCRCEGAAKAWHADKEDATPCRLAVLVKHIFALIISACRAAPPDHAARPGESCD